MTRAVFILGPTAVGKTDFIDNVSAHLQQQGLRVCIINTDVGQLYGPLSIGTAKPDLTAVTTDHHLFGIIEEPTNWNTGQYRQAVTDILNTNAYDIALCVGGSGFYHRSLLFQAPESPNGTRSVDSQGTSPQGTQGSWQDLLQQDPVRAAAIHPNDHYRIARALDIAAQGVLPSTCAPRYNPVARWKLLTLERPRQELVTRIDTRLTHMVKEGWLQEVTRLEPRWEAFLRRKNLLGYSQLYDVLQGAMSLDVAMATISTQTKAYAKRQMTYIRGLLAALGKEGRTAYTRRISLSDTCLDACPAEVAAWISLPEDTYANA